MGTIGETIGRAEEINVQKREESENDEKSCVVLQYLRAWGDNRFRAVKDVFYLFFPPGNFNNLLLIQQTRPVGTPGF